MAKAETKNERLSITPLGDRVVVKPSPKEETSSMGIIIPDSAKQDAPSKGTVVAVGGGRYDGDDLVRMTVKVGDTVLFSKYGYDEVKVDGQDYYILSESNVLAVLS